MSERIRVLIADDSPDIVELYEQLINGQDDLQCVIALNSARDLECAMEEYRPDAAVIDLTMPGPTPLTVVAALAPKYPHCHFVAYSGYDDSATRTRALAAGCVSVVSKGAHPLKLIEEIRRLSSAKY